MRLTNRSRKLRKDQTEAEKKLWDRLRNRQLNGNKFHRQYVIGDYICDFVCREKDLIIEIDGGQHNENKRDEERTRYLESQGYLVVRFWNNEVLNNIVGVMEEIDRILRTLTPALSLKGEGGFPTPKSERWKYTNLPAALKKIDVAPTALGWGSDVALLHKRAPGAARYGDTALWDLNAELTKDTKFVSGSEKITIDASAGQLLSPRLVVQIKKEQEATLVEHIGGSGAYWINAVTQVILEEGAILHHIRLINDDAAGVHTNFTHVTQARDSRYQAVVFNTGAALARHQIHAELQGPGAECSLNGVNLLKDARHSDTTITLEHQAPDCTSNQFYRHVLDGKARGVFQGKVHVHREAQKTDGYQLSNTLMLSDLAEMDTKPELEIYADDVKCSHGATTGRLDAEPLFYMQSRGIPLERARALMIESFVAEALAAVKDESLLGKMMERARAWLA